MTKNEAIEVLKNDIEICTIQQQQACDMAIKALEQQPCEDCISRAEALKAIEKEKQRWEGTARYAIDECHTRIAELPQMSSSENPNKWIPVSERLPEENITVIGTTKIDDIYKTELYDDCGEKKWYANGNFDVPIIAWMPLPEPYKAESEDKVCKDCYYNDGEVHAECVICDKTESEE